MTSLSLAGVIGSAAAVAGEHERNKTGSQSPGPRLHVSHRPIAREARRGAPPVRPQFTGSGSLVSSVGGVTMLVSTGSSLSAVATGVATSACR